VVTVTVARLRGIPGIGVDVVGDAADAMADPDYLRLENLRTTRPSMVNGRHNAEPAALA
jgi:hypothetical protein